MTVKKAVTVIKLDNLAAVYSANPVSIKRPELRGSAAVDKLILTYEFEGIGNTYYPATSQPPINAGTYRFTVGIANDNNHHDAFETARLTIEKAAQTITFEPPTNLLLEDGSYTFSAATENHDVNVHFRIDGDNKTATLNADRLQLLQSGSVKIVAHIDENNYTANEVARIITVVSGNTEVNSVAAVNATKDAATDNVYLADCGIAEVRFTVTPAEIGSMVIYGDRESDTFTVPLDRADIYTVEYAVRSSSGAVRNHTLKLENRFDFNAITEIKFNNVILVKNNPANNGGYKFTTFEWLKNNQPFKTGQSWSAGPTIANIFDTNAEYQVILTCDDGKILRTCPGAINVRSKSLKIYPNPALHGGTATLEYDVPDDVEVKIYNLQGLLLSVKKIRNGQVLLNLPQTQGIYLVTAGNESAKIIVE